MSQPRIQKITEELDRLEAEVRSLVHSEALDDRIHDLRRVLEAAAVPIGAGCTGRATVAPLSDDLTSAPQARALRICLLAREIHGPSRHSGIGVAFHDAACFLAQCGHDVTIAFVDRRANDAAVSGKWRDYYAARGVTLTGLLPRGGTSSALARAIRPAASAYRWLKDQPPFDLVHLADHDGLGYFAQTAKHLGVAFGSTHFVVHGAIPTIRRRLDNGQLIRDEAELGRAFMERRSAELADTTICSDPLLFDQMSAAGYQLQGARRFVQPSIVFGDRAAAQETPTEVRELVFLGRLEPRKGLFLFCDALDTLVRRGVALPRVSFIGDTAARAGGRAFVERRKASWNCEVMFRNRLDAIAALDHIARPGRLAVIPSTSQFAPMNAYRCLFRGLPFVACETDAMRALVAPEDQGMCLAPQTHDGLADLLSKMLADGARPAQPRQDLSGSLDIWRRWHDSMGPRVDEEADRNTRRIQTWIGKEPKPKVSICLTHYNRGALLNQSLDGIRAQTYPNFEVVLVDDGSSDQASLRFLDSLQEDFDSRGWQVVRQSNRYLGAARNTAARHASGDLLLFFDDDNVMMPEMVATLTRGLEFSGADIITSFSQRFSGSSPPGRSGSRPGAEIRFLGGALDWGFFRNVAGDAACLVRREVFERLGGFTEHYRVGKDDMEFYNRAVLSGYRLEVVPEALYHYRLSPDSMKGGQHSLEAGVVRAISPYLSTLPPALQGFLMYASFLYLKERGLVSRRGDARTPEAPQARPAHIGQIVRWIRNRLP